MTKKVELVRHFTIVYLVVFIVMEVPIRLTLQPDPWLLPANHWYFDQPLRFIIELVLVVLLLVLLSNGAISLLKIPKKHIPLLIISTIVSLIIFGLFELEQLRLSLNSELIFWFMWLGTGLAIGVGQELLYRGLLFTSLNQYFSETKSGVATTFLFIIAPLHSVRLWEYFQNGHFTTVVMLIGIYAGVSTFFQWLRIHTGSLAIPAIVHGVGNGITWVAVFA